MAENLTLYSYFRSSAAYRVRIALNLKNLKTNYKFVHLLKNSGEQHRPAYKAINPQELVPALRVGRRTIGQSLAIIEYLDEIVPSPPLLPKDPFERARVRQIAFIIGCDIHPINNLRVLQYLGRSLGTTEEQRIEWQRHWIALGFSAVESLLSNSSETGEWCHGSSPTLADICLIPQMANARRVQLDLSLYPTLMRIERTALSHDAFAKARPEVQPDAE